METNFEAEKVMVLVPIISMGNTIFNYIVNNVRNDDLKFNLKEFLYLLGGSLVYSIGLGLFTFFFYKLAVEHIYNPAKSYIFKKISIE